MRLDGPTFVLVDIRVDRVVRPRWRQRGDARLLLSRQLGDLPRV